MPIIANIDPNLMYIALIAGLWVGVTAAYVPGTGVVEFLAFLILVASFIALTAFATNWIAVVALVVGVSAFLVLPFFGEKYGRFAEIGLIGQAIGGYFLFNDAQVSPILIAITIALAIAYNRVVLLPTMRSQRQRNEYDESQEVLGIRGRVVKDLDPVGTVYVNKELWRARSDNETLTKDTPIIVVAQEGLELIVEKAKREDAPAYARLRLQDEDELPPQGKNGTKASR